MKKQYTTPTAKKVTFNYEKVVAQSGTTCHWGSYYQGKFCNETHQGQGVSLASVPECGWVVEREE